MKREQKMNKTLVVAMVMITTLFSRPTVASEHKGLALEAQISVNQERYRVGDPFMVSLCVTNIGKKTLKTLKNGWGYEPAHLNVVDNGGTSLEVFQKFIFKVHFMNENDLIELAPSEQHCKIFSGKLIKTFMRGEQGNRARGLFLDFSSVAFKLSGYGKYTIIGEWEINKINYQIHMIRDTVPNIWYGAIKSNEVGFEVVK